MNEKTTYGNMPEGWAVQCSATGADNRVLEMNAKQITKLFDSYGFTDKLGHDLILCVDFINLVDRATANPVDPEKGLRHLQRARGL